jgi:hypothetical protein
LFDRASKTSTSPEVKQEGLQRDGEHKKIFHISFHIFDLSLFVLFRVIRGSFLFNRQKTIHEPHEATRIAGILASALTAGRGTITRPRAQLNSFARIADFDFAVCTVSFFIRRVITDRVLRSQFSGDLSKRIGQ